GYGEAEITRVGIRPGVADRAIGPGSRFSLALTARFRSVHSIHKPRCRGITPPSSDSPPSPALLQLLDRPRRRPLPCSALCFDIQIAFCQVPLSYTITRTRDHPLHCGAD